MQQDFRGWDAVSKQLQTLMDSQQIPLNDGQKASLRCLAGRLTDRSSNNGMIIADEVGMGKTRGGGGPGRDGSGRPGGRPGTARSGLSMERGVALRRGHGTPHPAQSLAISVCVAG